MKDIVNEYIKECLQKDIRAEAMRRYLQVKYHINLDARSLKARIHAIKMYFIH